MKFASFFDGISFLLGGVLVVDAFLGGELLGVLVRLPGGQELPWWDGVLLGASLCRRGRWTSAILAIHAALAVVNCVEAWRFGVPFSLVVAAILGGRAWSPPGTSLPWRAAGAVAAGPALVFLHIATFGAADYRRPADAIVVFGARRGSLALHDRVREGARLYHAGYAPKLVLSGAPDEVPDMIRIAKLDGVPDEAIVADPDGVDTYSTVRNLRVRRVIAVSHDYHLARIQMTARRFGISCATVPCRESRGLAKKPWFVARECAAYAAYYVRTISRSSASPTEPEPRTRAWNCLSPPFHDRRRSRIARSPTL